MLALTFADTVVCGAQQQGVIQRIGIWLAMPCLCYLQVESCKQKCQDVQQALKYANNINDGLVRNNMQQADLVKSLQEQVKVLLMSRQLCKAYLHKYYCECKS